MSVILETSVGPIKIHLYTDKCPKTCTNFLKLSKIRYYENCLFHNIQRDYIVQTGDPFGKGTGGTSIFGILHGKPYKYFEDEIVNSLKHTFGSVSMASAGPNLNASEFFITTASSIESLNGKNTVFGQVDEESYGVLMKINDAVVDKEGRPVQVLRIKTVIIEEDPFPDPEGLFIPDKPRSPIPGVFDNLLPEEAEIDEDENKRLEKLAEINARSKAEVLVLLGDRPDADIKPPDNVLFICKLNPDTTDEDLGVLFSRFGEIKSVDIIKDPKTGNSLCYGFIEFEEKEACEEAYFKMQNVIIDKRRIHVDFSQSVAKNVDFKKYGGWKNYFIQERGENKPDDKGSRRDKSDHRSRRGGPYDADRLSKRSHSRERRRSSNRDRSRSRDNSSRHRERRRSRSRDRYRSRGYEEKRRYRSRSRDRRSKHYD